MFQFKVILGLKAQFTNQILNRLNIVKKNVDSLDLEPKDEMLFLAYVTIFSSPILSCKILEQFHSIT